MHTQNGYRVVVGVWLWVCLHVSVCLLCMCVYVCSCMCKCIWVCAHLYVRVVVKSLSIHVQDVKIFRSLWALCSIKLRTLQSVDLAKNIAIEKKKYNYSFTEEPITLSS